MFYKYLEKEYSIILGNIVDYSDIFFYLERAIPLM